MTVILLELPASHKTVFAAESGRRERRVVEMEGQQGLPEEEHVLRIYPLEWFYG